MHIDLGADSVLDRIRSAGGELSLREIAEKLDLTRPERQNLKKLLRDLTRGGLLQRRPRARYALAERGGLLAGTLRRSLARFGFVTPDRLDEKDVRVPVRFLKDAMDGDRVMVRVTRVDAQGRREGRVARVLSRRHQRLWGVYREMGRGGRVAPYVQQFPGEVVIPPGGQGEAADGMVVGVEMSRFPTGREGGAVGRIVETLGFPNEPGVDLKVILRKYGLQPEFPAEVEQEARTVARSKDSAELEARRDYREQAVVTIDGETAMDFDDAVSVEERKGGKWRLFIHIADVSHYVRPGSALDTEALRRGTSVYFPGFAVPMLPRLLSNDWCSLKPHVDRLVFTCVIDFNSRGEATDSDFHPAVIRSAARMTYTAVRKILVDGDEEERKRHQALIPLFDRMEHLFHLLLAQRRARGSLDLDLPEIEIRLDEAGRTLDIKPLERNVAHRIIEEFMLVANEAVAARLRSAKIPTLYRIHEKPDPRRLEDLDELLHGFGYGLGGDYQNLRPTDLQDVLLLLRGRPEERFLSMAVLRSLKLARYSTQNAGHFGLASPVYTHFTSPIRRYPDLIVHRLLRRALAPGPAGEEELESLRSTLPQVAETASRLERQAEEAERDLMMWKTLDYMNERVGEEYEGWVASVAPFGVYVRLADLFVEGLVHVSMMGDELFRFDRRRNILRSERAGTVIRLGDPVRVRVDRINVLARQVDFSLLKLKGRSWERASRRKRGGRRRHKGN